jgi:hypothetical protein
MYKLNMRSAACWTITNLLTAYGICTANKRFLVFPIQPAGKPVEYT